MRCSNRGRHGQRVGSHVPHQRITACALLLSRPRRPRSSLPSAFAFSVSCPRNPPPELCIVPFEIHTRHLKSRSWLSCLIIAEDQPFSCSSWTSFSATGKYPLIPHTRSLSVTLRARRNKRPPTSIRVHSFHYLSLKATTALEYRMSSILESHFCWAHPAGVTSDQSTYNMGTAAANQERGEAERVYASTCTSVRHLFSTTPQCSCSCPFQHLSFIFKLSLRPTAF